MKKKYTKKHFQLINNILSIITIISSLFLILNISKYASINIRIFALGIIILILLNILDGLLDLASNYTKKLKIPSLIFSVVLLIVTMFGNYYLIRIGGAVSNAIIDSSSKQTEEVTTSFVVFDTNQYTKLEDIDGKRVGYIDNATFLEGNTLPKALIEKEKLNVIYKSYSSYNDLLLALFNGDIDVAPLPKDYYSMFIMNDGYEEYLDKTTAFYSFTQKVEISSSTETSKDITKEPFTILLMGNDGGRTDTLILSTFNPRTMTATMTSIPRDSYVPIACYTDQTKDKITHARVVSRQCTINTVENFLDVKVDYFVEVNFSAVVEVADALGGLWLYSPVQFVGQDSSSERGNFTVWVGEGWQTMDGQQVLAFARERHAMPNGDNDRQINQQSVIQAMISKLMDTKDIGMFLKVVEAAGNNVKTNIPLSQMTKLAQYLITQMNSTSINSNYLLQIISTRILGYSSWMYHDGLQLPLYISRPYQGAVNDSKMVINNNLEIDYQPNSQKYFTFNIDWQYVAPNYIKDSYNEVEIHDPLPDFMPSMNGSNKTWLLSDVLSWQSSRPWINLKINEIWENEAGYNSAYAYNQVVTQSVKYGVKTSKITDLTIGIIKRDLDCSIIDNQKDVQCKNIVPKFIGMSSIQVADWSQLNNFQVDIQLIPETDPSYDRTKIGLVTSQLEAPFTKLSKLTVTKLTVYIMDYPSVNLPVTTFLSSHYTKDQINIWWTANMFTKEATYEYSNNVTSYPRDTVIAVRLGTNNLTADTLVRSDIKTISFILSPGTNNAPVSNNQNINIIVANGPYSGTLTSTDADANTNLVYSIVSQPSLGTLSLLGNTFTYTPPATFTSPSSDSFTFKTNDGVVDSNIATVTFNFN